ncbi:helix-turn-helix transcriptional regulator [Parapedobacter pyrenivorans]|uniref:helix-turn-helix transcriptional regulator n=1 Tax=Parapedobacter pyrenivorans TaxID=1305674 RepID=UPI00333E8A35
MSVTDIVLSLLFLLLCPSLSAQHTADFTGATLERVDQLQLQNNTEGAISVLETAIGRTTSPDDLSYLYAYQSGLYVSMDSLLIGKKYLDLSLENARKAKRNTSKAVAYRAKAYLNNILNLPDSVVKDALTGLKYLEGDDEDLITTYNLNYLLYSAYSKWDAEEKMEKYIRTCAAYAVRAQSPNLQANANNGISSMYLARYRRTHRSNFLDSSYYYLNNAFAIHQKHPEKVSGNTLVITCINLANYYLDFDGTGVAERKQKAFDYLALAEEKLNSKAASADKWINVLGIKSGFAKLEGNVSLAERYLLQGLGQLASDGGNYFKLEYLVNKELADISRKKDNLKSALVYQQKAEELLKKSFDEQQLLNAQKLEIQYETEKKDQQLTLLNARAAFQKRQNYLYVGIAAALVFALVFMFLSYHFKLRYSIEREKKIQQEMEEGERRMTIQIQLEKEEQARLKAEQELLEMKRQQLEKETLTNSLIIAHKNDMFRQIQDKIQEGDTGNIQKLLKEELLMRADFEDIKMQIQELHPNFFSHLSEKASQRLTSLDLKYCAYLYLKMTTKQIAQLLHVEPQSVRMFKYRLKQKFGLDKDLDLEDFLQSADF